MQPEKSLPSKKRFTGGPKQKISESIRSAQWLISPLTFVLTYVVWLTAARLIALSFVTYLMISPTSQFQDINDTFSTFEIPLTSLACILFFILRCSFDPLQSFCSNNLLDRTSLKFQFLPGFLHGCFFALLFTGALLITQAYRYLGFLIQFDDAPSILATLILQILALIALGYYEGFLFFEKFPTYLKNIVPEHVETQTVAIIYSLVKGVQFDLTWRQVLTLYLVAFTLRMRVVQGEKFARVSGQWAGFLVILHPIFGMPLFGNEAGGMFLIKPSQIDQESFKNILVGGSEGPLSGGIIQVLLILDLTRGMLKNNAVIFKPFRKVFRKIFRRNKLK